MCIYGCGREVTEEEPYSMRVMNGVKKYWHYKCYVFNHKTMWELSEDERKYLITLVLEKEPNPDGLPLLALRAIGYGK